MKTVAEIIANELKKIKIDSILRKINLIFSKQ